MSKLGRYEVLNELGKGAMGVVYLAKDPVIGRLVAVKTIRTSQSGDDDSESREFRERFVREAQTAGILSHPNIVTIHDIGEDTESRTSFIAMEYIEGRNLKSLLTDKKKFSWDQVADLIAQIGEALDYAHRKGIIHRDVKPANIMLTTDGKIKITDFGIAKVASSNLTTTGQFLGTPNYMSPEQVSGAPVDGRSDIFSLGVVLYELLTNRKPFQGDNLTAISYKIVHEDFVLPAVLSADVPQEFNTIVARAMAKDPWNRYQRGKDMALALYQLKAHLEEQKALQDLGSMVSAAENLPTLKLANRQELAAQAGPREKTTLPPAPAAPAFEPPASASWPSAADESDDDEVTTAAPDLAAVKAASTAAPASNGSSLEVPAPPQLAWLRALGPDWKKLAKAEVNPRWFWMVTAAAAGVLLLVVAFFALRAKVVARPAAQPDAVLEQAVKDRRQALEKSKSLFTAGKYEESLAEARKVLSRSPNNEEARKYAQMAESAVHGRQVEEGRKQQAAGLVAAAKTALAGGKPDEARQKAEEALAQDASNAEARSVRDEANTMIVEAKVAAESAARKKGAKAKDAQQTATKKNNAPAPSSSARSAAGAAAVPGSATLRVTMDAPIPEGNIMVAVNDQILLRNHFSFKKGEARNVSASISFPSGAAVIKAWLSGPDFASAFATTSAQLAGGDSRTLRFEYSSGRLSIHLQ